MDADCLRLGLHAFVHLELARACAHARSVSFFSTSRGPDTDVSYRFDDF